MTKQQYWEAHVKKNPQLADEDGVISLKAGMLRRLMEEAFDRGADHSRKTSDVIADMLKKVAGKR